MNATGGFPFQDKLMWKKCSWDISKAKYSILRLFQTFAGAFQKKVMGEFMLYEDYDAFIINFLLTFLRESLFLNTVTRAHFEIKLIFWKKVRLSNNYYYL